MEISVAKKKLYRRKVFYAATFAEVDPRWFELRPYGPFVEMIRPDSMFTCKHKNKFVNVELVSPYLYPNDVEQDALVSGHQLKDLTRLRITVDEIPYDYPDEPPAVSDTPESDPNADITFSNKPEPKPAPMAAVIPSIPSPTQLLIPKVKAKTDQLVFTPTAARKSS